MPDAPILLDVIGHIRSTLQTLDEAPRQGSEGAPDAWLEVDPAFARALLGIAAGDEIIVVTWLNRADRDVLEVHPRGDPEIPLAGVFATRSPDRPNPLGLHRVTVREISGARLRIGPIEAIDGTPVVDVNRRALFGTIRSLTMAFFDAYLKEDAGGRKHLEEADARGNVLHLQSDMIIHA